MMNRLRRLGRVAMRIVARFVEENLDQTSASLAYTTLLSIVPLVAVVLGVMSAMPSFLSMVDQLDGAMRNLLPEHSAGLIVKYILDFSAKASKVTVAGLCALVVTVYALLHTVENALNKVWKVPHHRAWWRRFTLYAALIMLWPLVFAYAVAAISYAVSLSSGLVFEQIWLKKLLSKGTGIFVAAIFFGGLYFALPNARVRLLDALYGGFFAAFGLLLMQRAFELYLSYFPSVTLVYGAFATVPIFLLWLYLSWAVILLGALVVVTLHEFRRRDGVPVGHDSV